IDGLVRETYFSSLRLSEMVLGALGFGTEEARRTVALFKERDEKALLASHAYANDEPRLIQDSRQLAEELQEILEADRQPDGAAMIGANEPA
ncbi:MAG TPA: glutathione-regulated potassium-efflux system protein KefB, partial [Acetobacteraceae bacterium]|nr:glutathione-regulated potassium-efflux system protein KefB [Acetobacteraceae bacterium]